MLNFSRSHPVTTRLLVWVLTIMMLVSSLPVTAFAAVAGTRDYGIATIAGSPDIDTKIKEGGTVKAPATENTYPEPHLKSEKYDPTMSSMASVTIDGMTMNGFCLDHTKGSDGNMTLTIKPSSSVTALMRNVYYMGYSDDSRSITSNRTYVQGLAKNAQEIAQKYGWSNLSANWADSMTDDAWRKVSQIAMWMATGNGATQHNMMVESTHGFRNGSLVDISSETHSDMLKFADNPSKEAQDVLQGARALYLLASYFDVVEDYDIGSRQAALANYPVETAKSGNSNKFSSYYKNGILDFSNAGEEPGKGKLKNAVDELGTDGPIYDDGSNYVIYYAAVSATDVTGNITVSLDGEYPDGTKIAGLTEDDCKQLGIDPKFAQPNATANTSISCGIKLDTQRVDDSDPTIIDGFGSATWPTDENYKDKTKYSYPLYYKVLIPKSKAEEEGALIKTTASCTSARTYNCYVGQNANSSQQDFLFGASLTTVKDTEQIVWGETKPDIPDDDTPNDIPHRPDDVTGVVKKYDAESREGLSGAKFQFVGKNNKTFTFETDGFGVIDLQWINDEGDNYIDPGTYTVTEVMAPVGYNRDSEGSQTITFTYDGETATCSPNQLIFYDSKKPGLSIQKIDADTGEPLSGAYFSIYKDGTLLQDVGPTGADGIVTYNGEGDLGLENGYYEVVEKTAPEGYLLSTERKGIKVDQNNDHYPNPVTSFVFEDHKQPEIHILKRDANTGEHLDGAMFEVFVDGKSIGDYETQNGGQINISYEEYKHVFGDTEKKSWTVKVVEKTPPPGYIIAVPQEQEQEVLLTQDPATFIFDDAPYPEIIIEKRDRETGELLPGASFRLKIDGKEFEDQLTTGEDGRIVIDYDHYGDFLDEAMSANPGGDWTVTVTEFEPPTNYNLDDQIGADHTLTQHLSRGQTKATFVFNDTRYRTVTVYKRDAVTNELLAGAEFHLWCVAPADGNGGDVYDRYLTTDESGKVTFTEVPNGTYNLEETFPPHGYVRDMVRWPEPIVVTSNSEYQDLTYTFTDTPETVLTIYKTDAVTGKPLAGAEYDLFDENINLLDTGFTITTDQSGLASSLHLKPGKYFVKETKAPAGYQLDPTTYPFIIADGKNTNLHLTDIPLTSLTVIKKDAVTGEPLAGAEFELRYDNGHGDCTIIGTYVTDEQGMIRTEPLPVNVIYGNAADVTFYVLKETKAPIGYLLPSSDDDATAALRANETRVCLKAGETNEVVIENSAAPTLTVKKVDENGNPVPGAKFRVENASKSDLVGDGLTDFNGEISFYNLKPGIYIVTEVSAPAGYSKAVPDSKTVELEKDKNAYVEFTNEAFGSLVIVLQDEDTGDYLNGGQFIVTRESDQVDVFDGYTDTTGTIVVGKLVPGWYTVHQAVPPENYYYGTRIEDEHFHSEWGRIEVLSGQEVRIYFKDYTSGLVIEKYDSKDPTKMLENARFKVTRNSDGVTVGEYVTGVDGKVQISGLATGLYTVTEIVAPNDYALDAESQVVHVLEGKVAHASFADTELSSISVFVLDSGTRNPVPGAKVEVWRQNGEMVDTFTTDATGHFQTTKLAAGFYVLKVVYVPEGYTLDLTEATVEVKNGVETTYTFEPVAKGNLTIKSLDDLDKAVPGMKVTLTKENGEIVGSYTTGNDGTITVTNLTPGWYVVTENEAPAGYVMSKTPAVRVEVKSNQTVEAIFNHAAIYGLQILTTVHQTGARLAGAVYEVTQLDGKIVGTYTSGADGLIFVELEPGWYVVKPVEVPKGYMIPDASIRNIEVKANELTTTEFVVDQAASLRVRIVDGNSGAENANKFSGNLPKTGY